jgi:hypothetical protein
VIYSKYYEVEQKRGKTRTKNKSDGQLFQKKRRRKTKKKKGSQSPLYRKKKKRKTVKKMV